MKGAWKFANPEVLADLWCKSAPAPYRITANRIKSHCFEAPLIHEKASHWYTYADELRSFICIKKSANPSLYKGPAADAAHICLLGFESFDYASAAIIEATETLRLEGIKTLTFGQDSRHFFPGVPANWPYLKDLLTEFGFVPGGECVDLEADLTAYDPVALGIAPLDPQFTARPCVNADLETLDTFFEAEFPNRWKYDVQQKWNLEGPETVFGLFQGAECVGFALIQSEGCKLPVAGAVWEMDLGSKWAALGPIGIKKDIRGNGIGDSFLASALTELKTRGGRRTIIDWTTLVDFYGKHGFKPTRRYTPMSLELKS